MCSLGLLCTSLILDIHFIFNWHLSKQGNPLTSTTWPYRGLKFTGHRGQVFFEVDRWPSAIFAIGSRAHFWLTCWKQGRIVRKPVNANPGLKVNRNITFSSIQMFLLLCFVYMVILNLKTEGQTIYRKPQRKVTKLKSKFYYFLGYLNRALNNPAQELRF